MENEKTANIGERIKEIRLRLGLNQSELGEKLGGLAISTISGYESGDRPPRADTLLLISSIGGVSLDWLITGEESDIPPSLHTLSVPGKVGDIADTIEPGRTVSGKSAGGGEGMPGRAESSNKEINVHEGVMMTTKVLSSNTGYANALWHNLKSFDAAVDREAEVGEMKEMMAEMMKKIDRLEEAVATAEDVSKKRDKASNS